MFSFPAFKFKGSGVVFIQDKTGVELLACLARQAFEDGRPSRSQQVPDIVLCEERAANLTEDMKVAALVSALGDLGIDAHALTAALGTTAGRV